MARRQEHFSLRVETEVDFRARHLPAGGRADALLQPAQVPFPGRQLRRAARARADHHVLSRRLAGRQAELSRWPSRSPLPGEGPVGLAAEIDGAKLQFFYRAGGGWLPVGPVLDASVISDEGGRGEHGSFTGAFVGMVAFDTSGAALPADFSYFVYENRDS